MHRLNRLTSILKRRFTPHRRPRKAQSLAELALVLPVLILLVLGLVEVTYFMWRYLDLLDLTREAARFASVRAPAAIGGTQSCNPNTAGGNRYYDFYYMTSCNFAPPGGAPDCLWCNGLNTYITLDPAKDDIVISVYRVITANVVEKVLPEPDGYWALSDHDADLAHNGNWQKDCATGATVTTTPHFNAATVSASLASSPSIDLNKGLVAVEFYHCYHQVLDLPILNWTVPNPLRMHAYTIMPLPAAQPTPTPGA